MEVHTFWGTLAAWKVKPYSDDDVNDQGMQQFKKPPPLNIWAAEGLTGGWRDIRLNTDGSSISTPVLDIHFHFFAWNYTCLYDASKTHLVWSTLGDKSLSKKSFL